MEAPPSYADVMNIAPPAYNTQGSAKTATTVDNSITLTINDVVHNIDTSKDPKITSKTTLADYIRIKTRFTATKVSCNEGGCGACAVTVTYKDPSADNKVVTRSIHACLRPVLACNNMSVTTNEGIGNKKKGYHQIQERLAKLNGSQCGYCANGFAMVMYGLLCENKATLTPLRIEQEFDGSLCRCTGYRPIMDAMKSFAKTQHDIEQCMSGCKRQGIFPDIEEMHNHIDPAKDFPSYVHEGNPKPHPSPVAATSSTNNKVTLGADGMPIWQDVPTMADLDHWLPFYTTANGAQNVMMVVAQTSLGIYKTRPTGVKLYIGRIPEMLSITQNAAGITIGSNVVITDIINYFQACKTATAWHAQHLPQAVLHLRRVGSVMLRNAASMGGNLMVMKNHPASATDGGFPSDVAVVLFGLGATVNVRDAIAKTTSNMNLATWLQTDFANKYIVSITVPWASSEYEKYMTYKIAQRQVNSHALVNAAMRAVVSPTTSVITGQPTIMYGGVFTNLERVALIEQALVGTKVTDAVAFQKIIASVNTALKPLAGMGRVEFRQKAAVNYFYKFWLHLQPKVDPSLQLAAANWMTRTVTTGTQAFQPDPNEYPVSIGMPKMEALQQTSGEAIFAEDINVPADCLFAYAAAAPKGPVTIKSCDTSSLKTLPGYVEVYTAKNMKVNEWSIGELLCSGDVLYAGQLIAVAVATTYEFARDIAQKLESLVVYETMTAKPITTIAEAKASKSFFPSPPGAEIISPPTSSSAAVKAVIAKAPVQITDTVEMGYQYHFYLENQVCYAYPKEDCLEVACSTQQPPSIQSQISYMTGLPASKVIVSNKRCGGAYGGKIANSTVVAALCGYIAYDLQMPVRMTLSMQQSMSALGNRGAKRLEYTLGLSKDGTIEGLEGHVYCSGGMNPQGEFGAALVTMLNMDNCYKIPFYDMHGTVCKTNIPPTTSARGPGWTPGIFMMEAMISRAASELNMSPEAIRTKNFLKKGDKTVCGMNVRFWNIPEIWDQLKASAGYDARVAAAKTFNTANKWVKRGISMTPVRFGVGQAGANFDSMVNVYPDGTIGVVTGGTEMGQGLNTKVAQCVAFKLGLTKEEMLTTVTVNETTTRCTSSSTNVTGGSVGSELSCLSAMHACETLNARLLPYRQPFQSWKDLIASASGSVELSAVGWSNAPAIPPGGSFNYNSNSAAITEVEVDGLTGQMEIKRVDIVFDCGISLNPMLDVGQVEGGFMFAAGWYVQELQEYNPATGMPEGATTWVYKPPSAFDIPEQFNVTLLKNAPNPLGVLSSKATAEPPLSLACSVVQAIEDAVTAVRTENGVATKRWVCKKVPLSMSDIQIACGTDVKQFKF